MTICCQDTLVFQCNSALIIRATHGYCIFLVCTVSCVRARIAAASNSKMFWEDAWLSSVPSAHLVFVREPLYCKHIWVFVPLCLSVAEEMGEPSQISWAGQRWHTWAVKHVLHLTAQLFFFAGYSGWRCMGYTSREMLRLSKADYKERISANRETTLEKCSCYWVWSCCCCHNVAVSSVKHQKSFKSSSQR